METTMKLKDNQQVAHEFDFDAGIITYHVRGCEPIVQRMADLHPAIRERAAYFGMAQVRVIDAAAIGRTDDDGNIIPEAERNLMKHARMKAIIDHYATGTSDWNRRGDGSGGTRSITVEAIARVQRITYDDALAMVDARAEKTGTDRKKVLAKLRGATAVIAAMEAIRAERRPAPKVDADAELRAIIEG